MNFKVDENLPREACDLLRSAGHSAVSVYDQQLAGAGDGTVADVCLREQRVLVTLDHDFLDIRAYPPDRYAGIIAMKLHSQAKPHVLPTLERRVIPLFAIETLAARLWVVDETSIRVRGGE